MVILDSDNHIIAIHRDHARADRHAQALWRDVTGLSGHLCCVQDGLTIRRGMKIARYFPDVRVVDSKRRHHAIAVYDMKTCHPIPSMTTPGDP